MHHALVQFFAYSMWSTLEIPNKFPIEIYRLRIICARNAMCIFIWTNIYVRHTNDDSSVDEIAALLLCFLCVNWSK